jgi:hypothetical protein
MADGVQLGGWLVALAANRAVAMQRHGVRSCAGHRQCSTTVGVPHVNGREGRRPREKMRWTVLICFLSSAQLAWSGIAVAQNKITIEKGRIILVRTCADCTFEAAQCRSNCGFSNNIGTWAMATCLRSCQAVQNYCAASCGKSRSATQKDPVLSRAFCCVGAVPANVGAVSSHRALYE